MSIGFPIEAQVEILRAGWEADIGVEMAENFAEMGLDTKLVELQNQILAPVDYEIAAYAQNEMRDHGIELILSEKYADFLGFRQLKP